jgi:hypothetical protein
MIPMSRHPAHPRGVLAVRFITFVGHYLYYRKVGHRRSIAWRLARRTLPS